MNKQRFNEFSVAVFKQFIYFTLLVSLFLELSSAIFYGHQEMDKRIVLLRAVTDVSASPRAFLNKVTILSLCGNSDSKMSCFSFDLSCEVPALEVSCSIIFNPDKLHIKKRNNSKKISGQGYKNIGNKFCDTYRTLQNF